MAIRGYEIVWSGTLAGQFVQTVQHLSADEVTDNGAFATAREICSVTNFDTMNDIFMLCLPEIYKLTSVRCRRVFPAGGPTAITLGSLFTSSQGGRGDEISSAQVNPVILWIAGTRESDLGKLYVPGIAELDIENMAIAPALQALYHGFIDEWITGITVGGAAYKGAIATRDTAPPHAVTEMREIMYGQVSPLIGTQRRRLRPV